jgi:aspartyl-tRNA(Asn)/glutamyl-tRNA(Gln) amidotransferase subunit B
MRTKEGSSDYRYFPEPDLVPVAPTADMRAAVAASMPELPAARRGRLQAEWGISESEARVLLSTEGLADYAEAAVVGLDGGTPQDVVKWAVGDVLGHLNQSGLSPEVLPLAPDGLAELVGLVAAATISRNQAKDVLGECLAEAKRPKQVVEERGISQVSDVGELEAVVDRVFADNADVVAEWRAGDEKLRKKKRGALMGMVMGALDGSGNPQVVNQLVDRKLETG